MGTGWLTSVRCLAAAVVAALSLGCSLDSTRSPPGDTGSSAPPAPAAPLFSAAAATRPEPSVPVRRAGGHRNLPYSDPERVDAINHTLDLIEKGGPFPYDQDGAVFQNREDKLPHRARGHYHEYTVITPGLRNRGPRRIVQGGDPVEETYYTDDHYKHFVSIDPRRYP